MFGLLPSRLRRVVGVCLLWPVLACAEETPWPEVLTLDYALSQASADHPSIQVANAAVTQAQAAQSQTEAQYGVQSRINARLRWVDPPEIAPDQSRGDHRLSLFINKRLYDFGLTRAQSAASIAEVMGQEQRLQEARNQQRIDIMAAYFDVLVADLTNARDEEEMSVTFIRADRAQDRNELGQLSDIDLLEARSIYQESRVRRYQSAALQRTTRAHLANVLNRPGQLPSELAMPELVSLQREVPTEVAQWQQRAEAQNPLLVALQARVERAKQNLEAARAFDNPVIDGVVEVSEYARDMGGYDNWRAGILINVPLTTGGRAQAERARRRAELEQATAELEQQRRQIQQAVLETWSELQTLKIERDRARALSEFRELYLDRSRALYELEVKSDLGDAMTRTSEARLQSKRVEFATALAWARLDALLGRTVYDNQQDSPDAAMPVAAEAAEEKAR
jgi:outer membrane protein TolC